VSWKLKVTVLALVLVANAAVLWWRYGHPKPNLVGVGPHVAALGNAQIEMVTNWRNAQSLPLTHDAVTAFVEQIRWENCASDSSKRIKVDRNDLSTEQRNALNQSIIGLIEAYGTSDPSRLYDSLSGGGEELSPASIASLKDLLTKNSGGSSEYQTSDDPRDLFLLIAHKIKYNSHWNALVAGSACVGVWRSNSDPDRMFNEMPLGGPMASLFKNQTRYHQLFQPRAKQQSLPPKETIVADVQFVVKHDHYFMSEPSPYHLRLVLEAGAQAWRPTEMVHVPTISGNSPALMF